jgi:acetolactate synthase-1/2/3 large subunit
MRAADYIVRSLEAHGIKRAYCVPGESYLALLDALHDSSIKVIICRHEGGAGFMACAEAKLTGEPALVLASRGPGATNAAIAVHTAQQDGLPVILMLGQVSRAETYRGVFQEMDYQHVFGSFAKAVFEIREAQKISELLPRALHLARQGVPGPVVFSWPEDVLSDEVAGNATLVFPPARPQHGPEQLAQLQAMIDGAERPLVVAGAGLRQSKAALRQFAEAQRLPVAVTWKNQDVFDNGSPLYAGHLGFGTLAAHRKLLAESDLIIAAGTRLGDVGTLGYEMPALPAPRQPLVHVYPDAGAVGRVYRTDLGIIAEAAALLAAMAQTARVASSARESWISRLNSSERQSQAFTPRQTMDGVDFGTVTCALSKQAASDAIVTTDAGNMSTWVHRHWVMGEDNTLLGGISGAMGLGVPAAVAASLIAPDRQVICFVGDGGVLMSGQELATAMAYGAAPKVVIADNGIYGTIRTHQEREYPGRIVGTRLHNPDFTAWARSFGVSVHTLVLGDDVEAAVKAFLAETGAAVLHVKSSAHSLSANGTL